MTKDLKAIKIHNRLNLYLLKTKKFKTDLIGIYIKRHLKKDEVAMNALISRLLLRGTQKYPSSKALNVHLEASYGMILVSDVVKYGEYHIMQFKLQFPDPRHLSDKKIFDKALGILNEVIFNPFIVDGGFDPDYFQQEKDNLIDEIQSRVNDKMSYALERCIECMYDGQPYAEYVYGDIKDIKKITPESLYEHYQKIISDSLVDICVMGEIDLELVTEKVKNAFHITENAFVDAFSDTHPLTDVPVKEIKEQFPVKQGQIVMGYQTNVYHTDPLYEASVLAYHMLGGGATSRLFYKLREEKSLCYNVYAKSDKFVGGLFIGAGIDAENYAVVKDLIVENIELLKITGVTVKELDQAKEAMIASIKSISDYPNSFINFFYTEVLGQPLQRSFDIDAMIGLYRKVSLENIQEVYMRLKLDTIYFIHGGDA